MNSRLLTATPLFVALLGGIYFGLFSCGGYAWHETAFAWTLLAGTVAWLALPRIRQQPMRLRILVVLLLPLAFGTAQAAAAPFYPASPDSLGAFVRSFVRAIQYGPC
ncbi:hypothetical protein ACFJGW_10900 [Burkholderiaceae bacterium UC74_6]